MSAQVNIERDEQMQRLFAAACALCTSGEARSIHIVTERRPSYRELIRLRGAAESHGLAMTVLGTGGVTLRSSRPRPAFVGGQNAARVRVSTSVPTHRRLAPSWFGELNAMSEGTR